MAAGQTGDGLVRDGLEDGGRNVLTRCTFIQERLHIRLSKDAAAARNRVDVLGTLGQRIQALCISLHQRGHLVDEGTGAAGAGTVHALLDTVVEVYDLCVLAAELDCGIGLRDQCLNRALGSDDLLHELDTQPLSQEHTAGTSDRNAHHGIPQDLLCLAEDLYCGCLNVSVVALIVGIDQMVVLVEDCQLDGRRADVDTETQLRMTEVNAALWLQLSLFLDERHSVASIALSCYIFCHHSISFVLGDASCVPRIEKSIFLPYRSPGRTNIKIVMTQAISCGDSRMPEESHLSRTPTSAEIAKVR